jgi:succinoglycan biosynthesis protein ExoM
VDTFAAKSVAAAQRKAVAIAICTYNRNEALEHLLSVLASLAHRESARAAVGVVVVDDSADQRARALVESFAGRFERGAAYRHSGARNISLARNLVLQTAIETGAEWIAMTDDDCEPGEDWLGALLRVQADYRADVVTGPLVRRAPPSAPQWLRTQPFLHVTAFTGETGQPMDMAFTNNSMISADLLRRNPDLRFDADFGRIGGEDMVFYRQVAKRGFRIVFASEAVVYENEESDRLTLGYQLRRHFWIGNSSVRTSLQGGATAPRMAVHGAATLARALRRPVARLLRGESPQWLYGGALVCEAMGKLAGVVGIRVNHR